MNPQAIYNNLKDILLNRQWRMTDCGAKYDVFLPSDSLGFSKDYKIYFYNRTENPDFVKEAEKTLGTISEIYSEDIDELVSIVIEDKPVLSLHIAGSSDIQEHPKIPFFDLLIRRSKELLQEVANFSVINKPFYLENCEESERYINYCNFLKNDRGSLITKIQLPNREEIRQGHLFAGPITGMEINNKLLDVTRFINEEIIETSNYEPSEEFLTSNQSKINANFSNKLKDFYTAIDYSDVEMSLKSTSNEIISSIKNLNKDKVDGLNRYAQIIKQKMRIISEDTVIGKIVNLNSSNVEGFRNRIDIVGMKDNVRSTIRTFLNSSDYKRACEAHASNRTVSVRGVFEKEKSHYSLTQISEFKVY